MRLFLIALQFLTIVPLRLRRNASNSELSMCTRYFPLVGILLGCILAFFEYILAFFLPFHIVILLLLLFLAVLTGGLHIDGFSDTVDAYFCGGDRDKRLRVMREPSAGPMGAFFVCALLLAKYLCLSELFGRRLLGMLLFFPAVSRMGMVFACALFPYARKSGTAEAFAGACGRKELIIAVVITITAGFALIGMRALFASAAVISAVKAAGWYFNKRLGGITGDILGFINEVGELTALLAGVVVL